MDEIMTTVADALVDTSDSAFDRFSVCLVLSLAPTIEYLGRRATLRFEPFGFLLCFRQCLLVFSKEAWIGNKRTIPANA